MKKERSKKRSNTYYKVIYELFLPIFRIVAFFVYGVVAIPKKYKEPILVLANHTSDMDFVVVAAHISNHMYFVCDRHVVEMCIRDRAEGDRRKVPGTVCHNE